METKLTTAILLTILVTLVYLFGFEVGTHSERLRQSEQRALGLIVRLRESARESDPREPDATTE